MDPRLYAILISNPNEENEKVVLGGFLGSERSGRSSMNRINMNITQSTSNTDNSMVMNSNVISNTAIDYSQNQDSEYGNAHLSENIVRVLLGQVVEKVYQERDIDYEFTDEDVSGIDKFLNLQLMLGEDINLIDFE